LIYIMFQCYYCVSDRIKCSGAYEMSILDNYLNVVEAAAILGVHWETVKRLCREGRIPAEKVHNTWLIHREQLQEFAATYNDPRRGKRRNRNA